MEDNARALQPPANNSFIDGLEAGSSNTTDALTQSEDSVNERGPATTSSPLTSKFGAPAAFIHRLPVEILLETFDQVLRPFDAHDHYTDLYNLILVCKGWANVIREASRYWFLYYSDRPPPNAVVLARAQSQPLRIDHLKFGDPDSIDPLYHRLPQWRSVSVHLVGNTATVGTEYQQRLWTDPAPLLQQVILWGECSDDQLEIPELFGGQAPKLRYLQMERCCLAFNSPIFKQLRLLDLYEVYLPGVSTTMFVKFLGTCENLNYLELHMVGLDPDLMDEPENVTLPKLATFRMHELQPWESFDILRMLHLPRCTVIKVAYNDPHGLTGEPEVPTTSGPGETPEAISTFKRILHSSDHITVSLKFERDLLIFNISAISGERRVFEFQIEKIARPLACLVVIADDWGLRDTKVPVTTYLTWREGGGEDMALLGDVLAAMPSITRLFLHQCKEAPLASALKFLSDPVDNNGTLLWPCPNLTSLFITDSKEKYSGSKVLRILKCRYGNSFREPPELVGHLYFLRRPAILEEIVLQGVENDGALPFRISRAVGGEAEIIWDPDSDIYRPEPGKDSDDEADARAELESDDWGDEE